jgi:hypothetical protein
MSRSEQRADAAPHEPSEAVRVHKGPAFVLPPHDRLFCVFDRREDGVAAIRELLRFNVVKVDDVWVFEGERGAQRLDPTLVRHGVRATLGRVAQRLLTGDAEYGDNLVAELRRGGLVLAIHVSRSGIPNLLPLLERHGGHFMAFGAHWNYVDTSGLAHEGGRPS